MAPGMTSMARPSWRRQVAPSDVVARSACHASRGRWDSNADSSAPAHAEDGNNKISLGVSASDAATSVRIRWLLLGGNSMWSAPRSGPPETSAAVGTGALPLS